MCVRPGSRLSCSSVNSICLVAVRTHFHFAGLLLVDVGTMRAYAIVETEGRRAHPAHPLAVVAHVTSMTASAHPASSGIWIPEASIIGSSPNGAPFTSYPRKPRLYLIHVPLADSANDRRSLAALNDIPFNRNLRPPFRFTPENVQSFANSLGALHVSHPAVYVSVKHTRRPWRTPATSMFSRPEKLSHRGVCGHIARPYKALQGC